MNRKKKENAAQSTRQLMGIDGIKDYCIATRMGDLVFFIIKPTNISVLSDSSISARIYALLNVVKGQAEIEMLALNSKESFERNKNFYQDNGFTTRRATEQDLKRMLGVYFEQNVTTEKFEDYDGDRWVIVGE